MEKLFTYGTLQDPAVQMVVFHRVVKGTPDTLNGYVKSEIKIGFGVYPIIKPDPDSHVKGQIIEVTPEELALIDRYEGKEYRRISVILRSGAVTWVYRE
jgi:gamma-glutamylcyclotransferase (GGCT)/AIG2-like uncharacterized protein YtfP